MARSDSLLATAFRANPLSMIITTLDEGRFIEVNPAFEQATGYHREEVIGRTALELQLWFSADEREHFVTQLNSVGRVSALTAKFKHKDGHIHPISISSEVVTIDSKTCVLGIFQDLSGQQKLEKARQRADTLFRTIVEESMDAVLILNAQGHYLLANKAAAEMTGYSVDELVNMHITDLYPDGIQPTLFPKVLAGKRGTAHILIQRKNGSTFHAEVYGTPIQIEGELRVLGLIRDISEKITTENELRESSQRFKDFAESSSDFLWEMDADLRFSWFSSRFCEITGIAETVLLGKTRQETGIKNIDPEIWREHLLTLAKHLPFRSFVHPRTLPDGNVVWLSIDGQPRFAESGEFLGYRGIGRDITEEVTSRAALKASERLFSAAFHVSPALSAITVRDTGEHLDVNDAWLTTLGFERDEVIGNTSVNMNIWAGGTQERQKIIARLENNERVEEQVIELRTRKGQVREVLASVEPIISEGQTRLFWCGYDITELNRQKRLLGEAAAVFDTSAEAIIVMDDDGRVINVNPAFVEITGFTLQQVQGRKPNILNSALHDAEFYESIWRSVKTKGRWRGELLDRRADGSTYTCWVNLSEVSNADNHSNKFIALCADIDPIKQSQRQLEHLAHHDMLTGLPNRLLFSERLHLAIAHASRHNRQLAVVFMDLDNFKLINDSLGHDAGDQLLIHVAKLLTGVVRQEDIVARLGGDEFTLLLEDVQSPEQVAVVAEKLMQAFNTPIHIADQAIRASTSMGISLYPRDADNEAQLLRNADAAMYRAKSLGRNTYEFYTSEMTRRAFERITIENSLRQALDNNEFELVYQPQYKLHDRSIIGAEALLRWNHPDLGSIAPDRFIPIAEETGLILPIGEWVLFQACLQARSWLDAGYAPIRVAVNLSGRQLEPGTLVPTVCKALSLSNLPAHLLELEVTETSIMSKAIRAGQQLEQLRQMGIRIAIDDFGTGYSSLSYLKQLPVAHLKIDKSFIQDLPDDPEDAAICEAIIALAKSLGLKVIAEGVETARQANFLSAACCEKAQGYYFARPLNTTAMMALLAEAKQFSEPHN